MHLRSLPHRRKMFILTGVLLAMMLGAMDATIVGPAMPTIVRELGGMQLLAWVFTIYSLTSTIAIPIIGKLSDLYGRKWFYLGGIALFLLGSVLCGAAPGMMWLIAARGLQGVGGGMMMANGMAVIGDLFTPRERGRYQGLMGAVFGLSSVLGPPVGGWLTDVFSWRWIFYINVPIGLLGLAVLLFLMPRPEHGTEHTVDWVGATVLAAGIVPLMLALNWGGAVYPWASPTILGLLGVVFVLLLTFIVVERRAAEPILDMALFRDRGFAASMTVLFSSGVGMFGSIMFLPLFMQIVQGRSASSSGALLMPMMVSMVAASITSGQIISRTGRYKPLGIVGLGVAAIGMGLLSTIDVATTNVQMVTYMLMVGAGMGVTMPLFTISLQSQFPERMGEVTGALQFFRSVGGAVGVALLGGVMNATFARELAALVARDAEKLGDAAPVLSELTREPSELLNVDALAEVSALLPPGAGPALQQFFLDVRLALTTGIGTAFLWSTALMGIAFLAMWFVREVPLGGHPHLDTPAEVGVEILTEEAVLPQEFEPVIVEAAASEADAQAPDAPKPEPEPDAPEPDAPEPGTKDTDGRA